LQATSKQSLVLFTLYIPKFTEKLQPNANSSPKPKKQPKTSPPERGREGTIYYRNKNAKSTTTTLGLKTPAKNTQKIKLKED
jgi:hypothetical protein